MNSIRSIGVIAIAGFAFSAHAQEFSLGIHAPTSVTCEGFFTIEVTGDSSFGTHLLGGGFSLVTNSERVVNMTWTPASWSSFNEDGGYQGNGNYGQVVFGQLLLPIPGFDQPAAGSELGSLIGSFQVEIVHGHGVTIDFELVAGSPFTLESVDVDNGLATMQDSEGTLTLGSASVFACPTPSTLALFGMGGMAIARRKRV